MGGTAQAFKDFWNNPLGNRTAGSYFLFVGLLFVIVFAWTRILKFITEA